MNKPNKIRIYQVEHDFVMDLVRAPFPRRGKFILLPTPLNIPSDAEVSGMYVNYERRSFDFVVKHDSFDPVKEGCMPPRVSCNFDAVPVELASAL
jgi:hypothetical protein